MSGMNTHYVKRAVPVRDPVHPTGSRLVVDMVICTRCGSYVWDLQAHEDHHGHHPARNQ